MTIFQEIQSLFAARGGDAYFGERVSMTEHGLQAAYFARGNGAHDALVIAALLHDVGHLLEAVPADIEDWKTDARHEEVGGRWLASRFGAEVAEPARLHVPAKRYLCATDAGYFCRLSAASVVTLDLQGGPMSGEEIVRFEAQPFHRDAVRLRQWDDLGKVPDLKMPQLPDYRVLIESLVRQKIDPAPSASIRVDMR